VSRARRSANEGYVRYLLAASAQVRFFFWSSNTSRMRPSAIHRMTMANDQSMTRFDGFLEI
jgi:hypothetical protein